MNQIGYDIELIKQPIKSSEGSNQDDWTAPIQLGFLNFNFKSKTNESLAINLFFNSL